MACTGLKRCRWDHRHAQYCFNVRLSRNSSEGNTLVHTLVRVKRAGRYRLGSWWTFLWWTRAFCMCILVLQPRLHWILLLQKFWLAKTLSQITNSWINFYIYWLQSLPNIYHYRHTCVFEIAQHADCWSTRFLLANPGEWHSRVDRWPAPLWGEGQTPRVTFSPLAHMRRHISSCSSSFSLEKDTILSVTCEEGHKSRFTFAWRNGVSSVFLGQWIESGAAPCLHLPPSIFRTIHKPLCHLQKWHPVLDHLNPIRFFRAASAGRPRTQRPWEKFEDWTYCFDSILKLNIEFRLYEVTYNGCILVMLLSDNVEAYGRCNDRICQWWKRPQNSRKIIEVAI